MKRSTDLTNGVIQKQEQNKNSVNMVPTMRESIGDHMIGLSPAESSVSDEERIELSLLPVHREESGDQKSRFKRLWIRCCGGNKWQSAITVIIVFIATMVVLSTSIVGSVSFILSRPHDLVRSSRCIDPPPFAQPYNKMLPEVRANHPVLIKNARVLDEDNWDRVVCITLKQDGTIGQVVGRQEEVDKEFLEHEDLEIYDAVGQFVTAGLIDMHSHAGIDTFPKSLRGSIDVNEVGPVATAMQAVDAINPGDPAFRQMRNWGGVTTAMILPGSANVIGGEATILKTRNVTTLHDMLVKDAPRALKFACGENPKRPHEKQRTTLPRTRMGVSKLLRDVFGRATQLMLEQDKWDCNPANIASSRSQRPHDSDLDAIVSLLRRQPVSLNVHAYTVQDMEMMLRLANEYGFQVHSFHHALEAHKFAHVLARHNVSVATFSDKWGAKLEAYDASVHTPKVLNAAGVRVAITSDHPAQHGKHLMHNAAIAHHYGLDEIVTINSVTKFPAEMLLMGEKLGRIKQGFHADLVVWDRHPLRLGARPNRIYIDSQLQFARSNATGPRQRDEHVVFPLRKIVGEISTETDENAAQEIQAKCGSPLELSTYAIDGLYRIYTMDSDDDDDDDDDDDEESVPRGRIVVQRGNITCIGRHCEIPENATIFSPQRLDRKESVLIAVPGFIEASTQLGLKEIRKETSTHDGQSKAVMHFDHAKHGIRMHTRTMQAAWRGGVTTAVSHLLARSLVNGYAVAFNTNSDSFISESVIKSPAALVWNVGNSVKLAGGVALSISGQISALYKRLNETSDPNDGFRMAIEKKIPIMANVHQADDISQILDLQQKFGFNLVIVGGAESHLLKERLVQQNVSVILTPMDAAYQPQQRWVTQRSGNLYNAAELVKAGVNVGLGMGSEYTAIRNLRWSAGMILMDGDGQVTTRQALATITSNVADMFGLVGHAGQIRIGQKANFALFDGHPLTFNGCIRLVALGSRVECEPIQR